MRTSIFALSLCGACNLPDRSNPLDPAVRPEIDVTVYRLDRSPSGDYVHGGVLFDLAAEPFGFREDRFLVDATGTTDPDTNLGKLNHHWLLGTPEQAAALGLGSNGAAVRAGDCNDFEELAGPAVESGCPAGSPDRPGACRLFGPDELAAFEPGPIPLCLRVTDGEGHRHVEPVHIVRKDRTPLARAGADRIVTVRFGGSPYTILFDGSDSRDEDEGPFRSAIEESCWVVLRSPVELALNPPPGTCSDGTPGIPSTTLRFQAPSDPFQGAELDLRFRFGLRVRDRYGWSALDEADVIVQQEAVWTLSTAPPVATRLAGRNFSLPIFRESFSGTTVANGPDGGRAHLFRNVRYDDHLDASRVEPAGTLRSLNGDSLGAWDLGAPYFGVQDEDLPVIGAVSVDQTSVWSLFVRPYVNPDPLAVLVVGSTSGGLAQVRSVLLQEIPAFDLLVAADALSAWGAVRGDTVLHELTMVGTDPVSQFPGTFTDIQSLDLGGDGRLYVADGDRIAVLDVDGSGAPQEIAIDAPSALRFDPAEDGLSGTADDRLWVVGADGLFSIEIAAALAQLDAFVTPLRDEPNTADAIRIDPESGDVWVFPTGTADALRIDGVDGGVLGHFPIGAPSSGISGVSAGGALVVSSPDVSGDGGTIRLLPASDGPEPGRSTGLVVTDATTVEEDGSAWLAVAEPPSIVQVGADGSPLQGRSLLLTSTGTPLSRPYAISRGRSADATSFPAGALWIADQREGGSTLLLAHTPSLASGETLQMVAEGGLPDLEVVRLRTVPGTDMDAQAWALVEPLVGPLQQLVQVQRSGAGIDSDLLDLAPTGVPVVGPAIDQTGAAWVAKCQNATSPVFDGLEGCACSGPYDATAGNCEVETKIAFATPNPAPSFVPWALSDVASCGTVLDNCSIFPVGIAFDPWADVLWLAVLDFESEGAKYRILSVRCASGSLQSCTAPNKVTMNIEFPASVTFEDARDLHLTHPELLAVDPGTGWATFLDPTTRGIQIVRDAGGFLQVVGTLETNADSLVVGR